jgi:muramoyltetrapeptide carboxypeptidase
MKPLQRGDCIGVFSSSSPTTQAALERLTSYFESHGLRVKVAEHTLLQSGYMAGPVEKRVEDFHSLIDDHDVKCVMTANGGSSAIQMVPLLDYALIRRNPKIICGLSDPTSILNAITVRSGIPTFHGPNGYNFGHKSPSPFTESNWWPMVGGHIDLPYTFPVSDQIRILSPGSVGSGSQVEGRIFGGNLRSLIYLLGSDYMPQLDECVLFIEEIGVQVHDLDSLLNQLVLSDSVDRIVALIVGQLVGCSESEYPESDSVEEMILRVFAGFNFPIISNVPVGHTADKLTIPIGSRVRLNVAQPSLQLIESPFA